MLLSLFLLFSSSLFADEKPNAPESLPGAAAAEGLAAAAAEGTLEIDGREQHEIWAAFRVARRSAVRAKHEGEAIEAALVPWHDGRVRVVRRFEPATAGIRILDRVEGTGRHRVTSRLHLPVRPGYFNKALMSLVLSYVFNPTETLIEIKRILRPGGILVLSSVRPDADASGLFTRLAQKVEGMNE